MPPPCVGGSTPEVQAASTVTAFYGAGTLSVSLAFAFRNVSCRPASLAPLEGIITRIKAPGLGHSHGDNMEPAV